MKFKIRYIESEYYKDRVMFLLYDVTKEKAFRYFLLTYLLICVLHILNLSNLIKFYPKYIELLIYSLGIGIAGMIAYTLIYFLNQLLKINKFKRELPVNEESINLTKDCIIITNNDELIEYNWNIFHKVLLIKNTIFLIPKNKHPLIRFNKNEIVNLNIEQTKTFLKKKIIL